MKQLSDGDLWGVEHQSSHVIEIGILSGWRTKVNSCLILERSVSLYVTQEQKSWIRLSLLRDLAYKCWAVGCINYSVRGNTCSKKGCSQENTRCGHHGNQDNLNNSWCGNSSVKHNYSATHILPNPPPSVQISHPILGESNVQAVE